MIHASGVGDWGSIPHLGEKHKLWPCNPVLFSVIFWDLNPKNEIFLCKNISADLFKLSDLIKLAQKLMNLF